MSISQESEFIGKLQFMKTEESSLVELKEAEFDNMTDKFKEIFANYHRFRIFAFWSAGNEWSNCRGNSF